MFIALGITTFAALKFYPDKSQSESQLPSSSNSNLNSNSSEKFAVDAMKDDETEF